MKMWGKLLLLLALVGGVVALSKAFSATTAPANAAWTGTWEGRVETLPAVRIVLDGRGGSVKGTATFYLLKRERGAASAHVDGEAQGALDDAQVAGNALHFAIRRHDGSVARFRMELQPDHHANLSHEDPDGGPMVTLVRVKR